MRRPWGSRRGRVAAVIAAAALIVVGLVVIVTAGTSSPPAASKASVAKFVASMKQADGTTFVATYQVEHFLFFQSGTIQVAQRPSAPGTKPTTNADGYTGSGRSAYLFHGAEGRVTQWIKDGTNVSACVTTPVNGIYGSLVCSRPSPFIPSNGFALEDAGFVPLYVLQSLQELTGLASTKPVTISTNVSRDFGTVRCLIQAPGPTTQTICIDHHGYVVSWVLDNGSGSSSRVTLTSLGRAPSMKDFTTLVPPTRPLVLPAV